MGILKMSWMNRALWMIAAIALAFGAADVRADVTYPARPLDRGFIADEANVLSAADTATIRAICDKLLTDKRVPLVVCTINSIAEHGASGSGWTVDRYARNLYDEWGLGSKDFNYGILVVVSKADRRARIEMGAGWSRDRDAACQNIMATDMVPRFKQGDYSGGLLAAVKQLDALGRVASKSPATASTSADTPSSSPTATMPAPVTPDSPAPAPVTHTYTPPSTSSGSNSYSRSGGHGILGGLFALPFACLIIPVIAIFVIFKIIRRAIGFGSGFGSGMFGGSRGYGSGMGSGWGPGWGGGWGGGGLGGWGGSSGSSGFGSSDSGSSSWGGGGGSSDSGSSSSSSFGGGDSGGGGASGSW